MLLYFCLRAGILILNILTCLHVATIAYPSLLVCLPVFGFYFVGFSHGFANIVFVVSQFSTQFDILLQFHLNKVSNNNHSFMFYIVICWEFPPYFYSSSNTPSPPDIVSGVIVRILFISIKYRLYFKSSFNQVLDFFKWDYFGLNLVCFN